MVAKRVKRRHHTVPRFYLSRFADGTRLIREALPGGNPHIVSVGDATVEKDFYLVEAMDGTLSDALEDMLSNIEGEAATAVRAICDDGVWPIPEDARWQIAEWVASQALRTPTQRQANGELADMIFKLQVAVGGKPQIRQALRDSTGVDPTDADVDDAWTAMTDFDAYSLDMGRNHHLQTLTEMLPGITRIFHARSWTLFTFKSRGLLTSDNPVCLIPAADHEPWMGVGLGTAGHILLPLGRRALLLMGEVSEPGRRPPDLKLPGSTALANYSNRAVAWNARTAVFHHPCDSLPDGITLQAPGQRRMSGLDQVRRMIMPEGFGSHVEAARTTSAENAGVGGDESSGEDPAQEEPPEAPTKPPSEPGTPPPT